MAVKIMDEEFKEVKENAVDELEETLENTTEKAEVQVVEKNGIIAWWKTLKWWQKLAIVGGVTIVCVGGRYYFKSKKNKKLIPVETTDILDQVQPVKVVVPMDPNNTADAAVQNLVDEIAKTME